MLLPHPAYQPCLTLFPAQLHGKFEDSAYAYLCTELCSGGDLERLVEVRCSPAMLPSALAAYTTSTHQLASPQEEGPLPEAAVARLLLEILHVVDTCHRAGFVHGDVKPANFVLKLQHGNPVRALQSGSGLQGAWLKAIDFGETLSRKPDLVSIHAQQLLRRLPCALMNADPRHLAGCSQMVGADGLSRRTGTPVFMSPEIFSRHYSKPADLWSCGMLTYQLLSGRFPFWCASTLCFVWQAL